MSLDSLFLEDFGRFKNKRFDFKGFNLFFGKNEAGKSTIADALFYVLAQKKPARNQMKRYDRYSVSARGKDGYIDTDALENVFAIRSGNVGMRLDKNDKLAKWIQDAIFNNEVNLDSLIKNIKTKAAIDKKNVKQGRLYAEIKEKIKKLEESIERDAFVVENEAKSSARLKSLGKEKSELEKVLGELYKKRDELKSSVDQQEKANQYREIRAYLIRLKSYNKKAEELEKAGTYDGLIKEGVELERRLRELEREEVRERLRLEEREQELMKKRGSLEEKQKEEREKRALLAELNDADKKSRGLYAGAGVAFALSVISFLLAFLKASFFLPAVVAAAMGAALSSVLFLSGLLGKKRFMASYGVAGSFAKWLEELRAAVNGLVTAIDELEKDRDLLEANITSLRSSLESLQAELKSVRDEYHRWQIKAGVESASSLAERERALQNKRQELRDEESFFAGLRRRYAVSNNDELASHLELAMERLEKELPARELSDTEQRGLRAEYDRAVRDIESNEQKLRQIENALSRIKGELHSQSNVSLLSQIEEDKRELAQLKQELEELEADASAYRIVADVFGDMRDELASDFELIVDKMGPYFSAVTGDERDINIRALSIDNILVRDATGTERQIELLSKGTRAAFFLAARLALAELTAERVGLADDGVLILDEPFETLDDERRKGAAEALRLFFDRHKGWQGFFFTSFADVKELVLDVFKDSCKVFELEV